MHTAPGNPFAFLMQFGVGFRRTISADDVNFAVIINFREQVIEKVHQFGIHGINIAAAMITVSATAVRRVVGFPAQTEGYPTHVGFIILAVILAAVTVLVVAFGFNALAEFATICGPWLMVMFTAGGLVLLPALSESVTGVTTIDSWGEFVDIAGATWTNTIGAPELITVWKDPEFDADQHAFYYARVIEIPTPRWTAYEAKRYGIKMPKEVPMITQERAYTSPIWYSP